MPTRDLFGVDDLLGCSELISDVILVGFVDLLSDGWPVNMKLCGGRIVRSLFNWIALGRWSTGFRDPNTSSSLELGTQAPEDRAGLLRQERGRLGSELRCTINTADVGCIGGMTLITDASAYRFGSAAARCRIARAWYREMRFRSIKLVINCPSVTFMTTLTCLCVKIISIFCLTRPHQMLTSNTHVKISTFSYYYKLGPNGHNFILFIYLFNVVSDQEHKTIPQKNWEKGRTRSDLPEKYSSKETTWNSHKIEQKRKNNI